MTDQKQNSNILNGDKPFYFCSSVSLWLAFMALNKALTQTEAQETAQKDIMSADLQNIHAQLLGDLENLYRGRQLLIDHLRVLRFYGQKGRQPRDWVPKEARAHTLWHEALDILTPLWVKRGFLKEEAGFIHRKSKPSTPSNQAQSKRKRLFREAEERLFQPRTEKTADIIRCEKVRQQKSLLFMGETMRQIFTVVAQSAPNYQKEEMEPRSSAGLEIWCMSQDQYKSSKDLGFDGEHDA